DEGRPDRLQQRARGEGRSDRLQHGAHKQSRRCDPARRAQPGDRLLHLPAVVRNAAQGRPRAEHLPRAGNVIALAHRLRERAIGVEHALQTYDLTTAVAGPRTVYRASFDFGFELPSPESTVVVDPSAARVAGSFEPLDVVVPASAISADSPPVVTLDGP